MSWKKLVLGAGFVTVVGLTVMSAPLQAVADPGDADRSDTAIAKANPQISEDLLDSLPSSILDSSSIWIDPSIPPGTPFLMLDSSGQVSVAPGQSTRQAAAAKAELGDPVAAAKACATQVTVPFRLDFKVKSRCSAMIGSSDSAKVTYHVWSDPDTTGSVTWQPMAFKKTKVCVTKPPLLPVCHYEWKSYWAVGQPGDGSATVPWGQVAAMAQVDFFNPNIPNGWGGYFTP